jgi:hypothetical protein
MAGLLPESFLTDVKDKSNMSFIEAGQAAGYSMAGSPHELLEQVRTRASDIGHFVELHIEQGMETHYVTHPSWLYDTVSGACLAVNGEVQLVGRPACHQHVSM